MPEERLKGRVREGSTGWTSREWRRILLAHAEELPEITQFHSGTFNIHLTDPTVWRPPNEGYFYARSRDRGLWLAKSLSHEQATERGSDFLANGNFIHPQIRVVRVNGLPIEGRLYFAGIGQADWRRRAKPWPLSRWYTGVEIIARQRLRTVLSLDPHASGVEVEVALEIDSE